MVLDRLKSFVQGLARVKDDDGAWWPPPAVKSATRSAVDRASSERQGDAGGVAASSEIELKVPGRARQLGCGMVLAVPAVLAGLVTFGGLGGLRITAHPYVGGGIAAALGTGALYFLLGLLTPTLRVLAERETFDPTRPHTLAWAFSRGPRSVKRLRVRLAGQERATYRQGTSTTTDTNTFHQVVVYDTHETGDAVTERGTFAIEFPADAMHSFKADNNEIRWTLEVKAWIPLLPDIRHNVILTVWPGADPGLYYRGAPAGPEDLV